MKLDLHLTQDVEAWSLRHSLRQAPSLWPYGLEHLRADFDVRISRLRTRDASNFLRRRLESRSSESDWALAWDERTGLRMAAAGAAGRRACGVIWASDDYDQRRKRLRTAVLRKALAQFDLLWCLSRPQTDAVSRWLDKPNLPVEFLRFGVDTDFWAQRWATPKRSCTKLVLCVGRDPDRDWTTAVRAAERIASVRPDVRFLIQGTRVASSPSVEFFDTVPHDQLRDLYAQADLVLVATRQNLHVSGMTVALEAQAMGRPLVMSLTPGLLDYVTPATCRLVAVSDDIAMGDAVLDLLEAPNVRDEMGAAARAYVEAHHRVEQMASRLSSLLQHAVAT